MWKCVGRGPGGSSEPPEPPFSFSPAGASCRRTLPPAYRQWRLLAACDLPAKFAAIYLVINWQEGVPAMQPARALACSWRALCKTCCGLPDLSSCHGNAWAAVSPLLCQTSPSCWTANSGGCRAGGRAAGISHVLKGAARGTPKGTMNQLADFYYCISLLKIVRTVSYRLYTIMRYLW